MGVKGLMNFTKTTYPHTRCSLDETPQTIPEEKKESKDSSSIPNKHFSVG